MLAQNPKSPNNYPKTTKNSNMFSKVSGKQKKTKSNSLINKKNKLNNDVLVKNKEKILREMNTSPLLRNQKTNKKNHSMNKSISTNSFNVNNGKKLIKNKSNKSLKTNSHKLSPQTKDLIIEKLFKMKKTAKAKDLKQVLIDNQIFKEISSVTGLAEVDKFMSNMSSYIDMKEIFGIVDENNIEMIENIIEWITIFEDKKILKCKK